MRVSRYKAVEPLVYDSSCWDASQLLQGCGTARLHLVVLGRGSATTRLWNRSSTSRRVGTRVSRYKAVEPLVYVSSCWDAGQPLQGCGTARLRLVVLGRGSAATRLWNRLSTSRRVGTRISRYTAVEPLVYISSCWDAGQPLQNLGTV